MRKTLFVAALITLAACGSQNARGIYFTPPEAIVSNSVTVGGGSTAASVELVAQRLAAAGFRVTRKSASGTVRATSTSLNNIDCGEIRQVALGNTSEFDGNAELAVIYRSEDPIVFVTRSVSSASEVVVNVSGNNAQIAEAHNVTVTWRTAKKELISNETKRLSAGSLAAFEDNTVCTSSGRVARIVAG